MNREHITSEQIWFLLTVWETRSITLTAQQLNVSVATASRQMTTLRGLLHDPLFIRGRDGLVPTARMNELLPKLRSVQDALIDIVRRPVQFSPADLRSTIRVAGVDNAIFGFLMPCLRELYGAATANAVVWKARMIWHERTERDPALQWFRSVIAEKLRGLNPDEVAKKLSEPFDLYDPVWELT